MYTPFVINSFLKTLFGRIYCFKYTQRQCISSFDSSTAMNKDLKKPYILVGFEPGIFCSGGGRDDHGARL
jgi:hypothetical protein